MNCLNKNPWPNNNNKNNNNNNTAILSSWHDLRDKIARILKTQTAAQQI